MNISNLKMKDLAEIETLSGMTMDEWETGSKVKLTMAIAYVMKKQTNPDIKFEDIENMGLEEINALVEEQEDPKAKVS
jgi:hypothetical protein